MPSSSHAVIVGGGIGGLLAAQILRRRFSTVTLIERDRIPAAPGPRRGVPQGRCLHMLMAGGLRVIERWLPGFGRELEAAGGSAFDVGARGRVRLAHGWLPRAATGITMHAASRALLEHVLRERVRAESGPGELRILEGHGVQGPRLDADGSRVVGVHGRTEAGPFEVEAELTVVATGRGGGVQGWLGLAEGEVPTVTFPSTHRYVSRWARLRSGHEPGWRLLSIAPAPGVAAGGAVFAAEGGRWGVVLSVPAEDSVPDDDDGFLRRCEGLASPELAEALRGATWLGPARRHQRTDNRLHRFDEVERWPAGLVAVGDAVCALDPYFGLGMSSAVLQAEALAEVEPGVDSAAESGRAAMVRVLERARWAWGLATEHRRETTARERMRREALLRLAPHSPELARVLLRRMHLLDPPEVLEHPATLALVERVAGLAS